ncbi:ABC transporter permease [Tautonia plasticadhaerens]|uniref:ABC-2 family transporter protein n=1 Tax=Tautonia plasticadhaerens TaxID=2527974 RepID=A0A518GUJ7_9BACT|nr:ABC transporter permease subunit [Tautonia plasticadhaerens]QDV32256.1 ABC-2 family transporter protein [Tautonia plasticadhaerens]
MQSRRRWRLGPGPVFAWEWLTGSRRWQLYAGRVLFGMVLLLSIWAVWERFAGRVMDLSVLGQLGTSLYVSYALTQLGLVCLVTPAVTSGAICQEKARGSLLHLLTTDLSDAEIVFGKLLARLVPVGMLLATGVPVLMICGLLGGLDPNAVLGAVAVTAGTALLCCSGALMISVWARKPHGALMGAYFALTMWLLLVPAGEIVALFGLSLMGGPGGQPSWLPVLFLLFEPGARLSLGMPPSWLAPLHPFWMVLAPYSAPGTVTLADQLRFLGLSALGSGVMALVSVRSLRRVYLGQLGRPRKATKYLRLPQFGRRKPEQGLGGRGWLPGPSLDANPVLWREWHRNAPSLPQRILWHIFVITSVVLYLPLIVDAAMPGRPMLSEWLLGVANGFTVTYGLLLLSVSSSTSMSEERARGSLDILMSTPLPTSKIVWGKWWGAYRGVLFLALMPAAVAVLLGVKNLKVLEPTLTIGLILSQGAILTSLGVLLATRIEKQGRAVGLSVAAFGALSFGWPLLVVVMGLGTGPRQRGLEALLLQAPWYGSHRLLDPMVEWTSYRSYGWRYDNAAEILTWGAIWLVLNTMLAALLVARTLSGFNRHLGRMDENPDYAGRATVVLESGPDLPLPQGPTTLAPSAARQT